MSKDQPPSRTHIRVSAYLLFLLLFSLVVVTGCAGPPKPPVKPSNDDFFKKWKTVAESSEERAPVEPKPVQVEPAPTPVQHKPSKIVEPAPSKLEKPLPTQKVSLRMHNADVVVVLRTLSRSVNQNIVMNDKVKGLLSIEMDGVPWDQAFRAILQSQGLNYLWEGDLIRVLTLDDMEMELKINGVQDKQKARKKESKQADPMVLRVVPIDYAKPKDLQEMLKEYLSKDEKGAAIGSIMVDEHTNSIVINAVQEDINRLVPLIQELDKPINQILIESNIVEATKDTARGLGIQWGGAFSAHDVAVTPGGINGKTNTTTNQQTYDPVTGQSGISGQGFGVNFPIDLIGEGSGAALGLMFGKIGGNILDMQLLALQKEGKVNILSSPSIITMDNQVAFTENGAKVPYLSVSQNGTDVKFEEVVLKLEIKPHVISHDTLKMDITVKKDEVDPARNVAGNPFIIKKQTKTTLIAKNGETIVISGLSKETTQDTHKGVPGMKDTPLLGWLFRSNQTGSQMEEVLIFITPHILKEGRVDVTKERTDRTAPEPSGRSLSQQPRKGPVK